MPKQILDFWFSEASSKRWFDSTPEFDRQLTERFERRWEQARDGELDDWKQTADGCLALIILLDQLPLNMYRGTAKGFATEAQSREVARHAIEQGFDHKIDASRLSFLYLPFMHSENLADQKLALELFDKPGLESSLRFAHHHHDIVEQFGRFPHRNQALGRENTPAEQEYLSSDQAFTG